MLDEYGFETYEENELPLAYLITIRTFGTWLHGDERHSVDRHGRNIYGTPDIPPNQKLAEIMKSELKQSPVVLNDWQRKAAESAIRELCEQRRYSLQAINVRSNHAHAVVSAQAKLKESPTHSKHLLLRNFGKRIFVQRVCAFGLEAEVGDTCGSHDTWRRRLTMFSTDKAMCLSTLRMSEGALTACVLPQNLTPHLLRACFRNEGFLQ